VTLVQVTLKRRLAMLRTSMLALLAALAFTVAPSAMDLILEGEGRIISNHDDLTVGTSVDADGDGAPELCFTVGLYDEMVLNASKLDGSLVWSYLLDKNLVCPGCGPEWEWWLVSFGEVDPTPGREAVLKWYDYTTDQNGVVVVNTSSGQILQQFPGKNCDTVLDFDFNGTDEVIIESNSWPDYFFEVWGYALPGGVAEGGGGSRLGSALGSALCRPNPTDAGTSLELKLARPAELDVSVVDVQGRLVRDLGRRMLASGRNVIHWDGASEDGRTVAPGIYYLTAREGDVIRSRAVVRMD
jgi:hypothetical protein